ncbi:MAG: single-stranded DNA-binding protein [Deltaproteobacteria bacterium]|nr:single-stranded DNA-binding protein [Deltaproteobacteria bacterium]
MASINKVILIGNLGGDPEVRFTPGGQAVANFNIATNERWKDKNGQPQERTEWHRIVVWGRLAELCRDYLAKGRRVYLEGRLQTRKWEDKQGQTRYTTEIVAQVLQFLDSAGAGAAREAAPVGTDAETPAQESSASGGPPPFDAGEDIPF